MYYSLGILCRCFILKKRVESGRGGLLRDIYTVFFKYHSLMPDEVGRQNPWVLFRLLDSLNETAEDYDYSDNEHLMMFYGK